MPRQLQPEPRTYYECRGACDSCGHLHRSLESSARCCVASQQLAEQSGGWCDRIPWPIQYGEYQAIDEATACLIDHAMEAARAD